MNKLNDFLETLAKPFGWLTDWILRLVLGIGFFLYGYGKLPLPPKKMVTWFESEGIPAPELVSFCKQHQFCCQHTSLMTC